MIRLLPIVCVGSISKALRDAELVQAFGAGAVRFSVSGTDVHRPSGSQRRASTTNGLAPKANPESGTVDAIPGGIREPVGM